MLRNARLFKYTGGTTAMQKTTIGLTGVVAGMLIAFLVMSVDFPTARAQAADANDYGAERALIENLQARYLFALDFKKSLLFIFIGVCIAAAVVTTAVMAGITWFLR